MTAIIPVNDQYRIELDACSWQVSKWKRLNNHPDSGKFEGVTWHGSLQKAGESLVARLVADDDLEGIQEIIEALAVASRLVAAAIKECPLPNSWPAAREAMATAGC